MNVPLRYTSEELSAEHDYARLQEVAGHRLHGGFDASGAYLSPHSLVRWPAVRAWQAALEARGGALMPADSSLLAGLRTPNTAQQKLLLLEGLGQTFWNTLTITGHIEARGRFLADLEFPDFQPVIEEDISRMAIGHLNRGLLKLHGLDEGGEVARGIGGHDVMWFALRDLAFGAGAFGEPPIPDNIAREDQQEPFSQIHPAQGRTMSFLMNLLLIEFRAEIGFSSTEALLRDPELFVDRRPQAEAAAEVVCRIRQDEELHLTSLRVYLGELRSLTFRTTDGGRLRGAELIDPFWAGLVQWATVEQPTLMAERSRQMLTERILAHPEGDRILPRFEALA